MRVMKSIVPLSTLMALVLVTGCAAQPPVQPASSPQIRSISTNGTSTLYVKPDEVTVQFAVESRDLDLAKAKSANVAAARAALEALRSLNIQDKDIQTQLTRSDREYQKMPDGHMRFSGYVVTRKYSVKLHDLSQFEPLIDTLLAKEDYTDQEYSLDTKQRDQLLEKARQQAVQIARDRAKKLAAELGCAIGPPAQIRDSSYNIRGSGGNLFGGGGGSDSASGVTPLGEIELTATVEATFDLIPPRR